MRAIDFFDADVFRESPRVDRIFGINDAVEEGQEDGKAYTTTDAPEHWNVTVRNERQRSITFQPLDHNMEVTDAHGDQYSLCDGMLYTETYGDIIFVELKSRGKNWIGEDVGQLESTINLFLANHDYALWHKREAYAANNRHPQFKSSHRIEMQQFYNRTHFFLRIVATILIK